jgi:hypothetical protein
MKHRGTTTLGVISIPACPLELAVLKTVHSALVIQMVKQPYPSKNKVLIVFCISKIQGGQDHVFLF